MDFIDAIKDILQKNGQMTIPAIRDVIYEQECYTEHRRANHDSTRQAILNLIAQRDDDFVLYNDLRPKEASLKIYDIKTSIKDEEILEDLGKETGIVYILKTKTFTENNEEIIKIGFTTQSVKKRINQLYQTGTPYKFIEHKTYETKNYIELEKALHKLLKPFQINPEREFFTSESLKYIDKIVEIHNEILDKEEV